MQGWKIIKQILSVSLRWYNLDNMKNVYFCAFASKQVKTGIVEAEKQFVKCWPSMRKKKVKLRDKKIEVIRGFYNRFMVKFKV